MEKKTNPRALRPDQLVELLLITGFKNMTIDILQQDVENGAPQNADGTFNLINYMAWVEKEINSDESDQTQTD